MQDPRFKSKHPDSLGIFPSLDLFIEVQWELLSTLINGCGFSLRKIQRMDLYFPLNTIM